MQYELMRYIAAAHRCVTVVGDPDQSSTIYILTFNFMDHLTSLISIRLAFCRNRELVQDAQRYMCLCKGTGFRNAENKFQTSLRLSRFSLNRTIGPQDQYYQQVLPSSHKVCLFFWYSLVTDVDNFTQIDPVSRKPCAHPIPLVPSQFCELSLKNPVKQLSSLLRSRGWWRAEGVCLDGAMLSYYVSAAHTFLSLKC